MELLSKSVEKGAHLFNESILGPRLEFTPMVFGVLPEDFDEVEFRAVRRKVKRYKTVQ